VDEADAAVCLVLLQHHDTGGDGSTKEQVAGQLNNAVDEVVIHQILANLLLCSAPVQDAGETDNSGGAVSRQPGKAVHDKGQVCLALRGQHTRRGKTGVVDQHRIGVSLPLDGIGRIGDDQL